jgi:hypothetical protein
VVAPADLVADGSYQLADAAEGSSPDTLVGDFSEEAFHQIQPGSTGRCEVPVIAGVGGKPGLHRGGTPYGVYESEVPAHYQVFTPTAL